MSSTDTEIASGGGSGFYAGYVPSLAAGIVFLILFSLLTITITAQTMYTWRHRRTLWWTGFVILGGICEILGWSGRIASHINVDGLQQFLMQQVCLILGPCFFSAYLYGVLGAVMTYITPENPLVKPKYLAPTFIIADVVSLAVQGAGGGQAGSSAGQGQIPSESATWTMAAGVILQLFFMLLFLSVASALYWRHRSDPRWSSLKHLSVGSLMAALLIILRGFFRSLELGEGWTGHLYAHEGYLIGLDAVPMVLCLMAIIFSHPTWTLPEMIAKEHVVERPGSATSTLTATSEKSPTMVAQKV